MTDRYSLRSPPVRGVKAATPYRVSIVIYDRAHKGIIWQTERSYSSQVSDRVVPKAPLTMGPGYHPSPEGEKIITR